MGYFPFFIDIKNKPCIIVGGGRVALRKLERLLPFEPDITVIAPEICGELLRTGVKHKPKSFEPCDLDGVFMVISASNDERLNAEVYKLCLERNILVNTVDDKDKCGFIFPAIASSGGITAAVSTGGKSPLYAKFLRERIESLIEDFGEDTAEIMGKYRTLVKSELSEEQDRKKAFENILRLCVNGNFPDEKKIREIIEDLKNK